MGNKGILAAGIGLGCLLVFVCIGIGSIFLLPKEEPPELSSSVKRVINQITDKQAFQNNWRPPLSAAPDAGLAPNTVGDATLRKYTVIAGVPVHSITAHGFEMTYDRNGQTWQVRVFDAVDVPDYLNKVHLKHINVAKTLPEPKGFVHSTDPETGARSLRYHSSKESGFIFNGGGKTVHGFVPANEDVYPWLRQYLETIDGS